MIRDGWADARNLLLIRLDNIGDVVLLSAAIRTVRENLPEARLTLMASPAGSQAAPLLPWLDDLMIWRAVWQDVGGMMPFDPAKEMELVETLRARQFDAAIVFTSFSQGPHGAAYACYLAGIPLRLGDSREFGGSLLSTEVRSIPDGLYQAERSLRLLESVGFQVRDRRPRIQVPEDARQAARALLLASGVGRGDPYVVVQPGASCQARRYPLERFGAVARLLSRRTALPVLLVGMAREAPELEEMAAAASPGVISIAGKTRVEDLAAVVSEAGLAICNNSLTMHLSAALNVPSLVLYSGTDLESQWRSPYAPTRLLRRDTWCSPCYLFECPHRLECLEFTPEEVVSAAEKMLGSEGVG